MKRDGPSARELVFLGSLTDVGNFRERMKTLWVTCNEWCDDKPYHIVVCCGSRTPAEQMKNWAIGREKTSDDPAPYGSWNLVGKFVTKVLPPQCAHCYGAAVDFAFLYDEGGAWVDDHYRSPDDTMGRLSWHPAWQKLAFEAGQMCTSTDELETASGLTLWSWDLGHIQLVDYVNLARSGTLRFTGA